MGAGRGKDTAGKEGAGQRGPRREGAALPRRPGPAGSVAGPRLTASEWLRCLPFLGVLGLLGYRAVRPLLPKKTQQKGSSVSLQIQKENPKVANEINVEDLCLAKAAYWGVGVLRRFLPVMVHVKTQELAGDNVHPLILKKKEESL